LIVSSSADAVLKAAVAPIPKAAIIERVFVPVSRMDFALSVALQHIAAMQKIRQIKN